MQAKTITVSSQNLHAGFSNDKASRGFFNDYEQASKLIDEKKYDEAKSRETLYHLKIQHVNFANLQ